MNTKLKYSIKIPQDTSVIYCEKEKIFTVIGPLKRKSMNLKLKIFVNESKKTINVSNLALFQISNAEKKKIKALQNTTIAQIKYLFIESSVIISQKLKMVGVGYRIDFTEMFNNKLLTLKLGYSHAIYVKVPENLIVNCFSKTKFFISGSSYDQVNSFSTRIRANKVPEPYKGKGILYEGETVSLKEGKKI